MPCVPRTAVLAATLACASARLSWLKRSERPGVQGPGLPCRQPVKRAPVIFPEDLVLGGTSDAVMYSGYVNVTDRDYLFYWFAEARAGAPPDAPLIVWSNGGPGCSAMEGMTTEHGPLVLYGIKEDGKLFAGKLSNNPYSWNNQAHVLYVDQPRYVGYSCGTGPFVTSSLQAGKDMVTFLRGWRLLFPEHARRELILAAESYGGHYVPAWSSAILDYNIGASDPLVLIGLAIGNGIVNESVQGTSFPEFASRQGLIPPNDTLKSNWGARELMKNYLGYVPNYYDYRLTEQDCCGCSSYNYKPWSDWLLREDVTRALNVCGNAGIKAFGNCAAGCIDLPSFDKNDNFSYSGALGRALQQGIRVTLYYGMQDTACNYVGGFRMATALEWTGGKEFVDTPLQDLIVGGVPSGKIKTAGGLTWVQVEGAGHMVPINNPAAASFAIGTLIQGSGAAAYAAGPMAAPSPAFSPPLGRAFTGKWLPWATGKYAVRAVHRDGADAAGIGGTAAVATPRGAERLRDVQALLLAFACGCVSMAGLSVLRTCPMLEGRRRTGANARYAVSLTEYTRAYSRSLSSEGSDSTTSARGLAQDAETALASSSSD